MGRPIPFSIGVFMNDQFMYQGRWVPKAHFRAFVYGESGQKLAKSYEEYTKLIESGLWFPSKDVDMEIKPRKIRKPKNGTNS